MSLTIRDKIILFSTILFVIVAIIIVSLIVKSKSDYTYCQINYGYGVNETFVNYQVNFNLTLMQPNFVVYTSTKGGNSCKDCKTFYPDPYGWDKITTNDYTNSGYQRGHLVPNSDYGEHTFYITNVVPMLAKFNEGYWLESENKIRKDYFNKLIVKGCLFSYDKYVLSIRKNKLYVPYGCYYTVLDQVEVVDVLKLQLLDYGYIDQETGQKKKVLPYWITC